MFDIGDVLEHEFDESEENEDVCEHGIGFDEICEDCEEEEDGEVDE
ncbi:MAG: hypothetical protein V1899_02870 [Planctomycetota bacterium]